MGQADTDASLASFVSSIIFTSAVSAGLFILFAIVRRRFPRIYSPKTYLGPAKIRPPDANAKALSVKGVLGWVYGGRMLDERGVIDRCGMDAFMFLEFLHNSFFMFLLFTCLAVPILIPLNVVHQRGLSGLNETTIGNIIDANRLWAHLVLTVLFSITVLWGSMRAVRKYIRRRQRYLLTDDRAHSLQATTILVCGIPEIDCNVPRLEQIFGVMPGGVRRVWLAYRPGSLEKENAHRMALTHKLEIAECTLLRKKLEHHSADNQGGALSRLSINSRDMLHQPNTNENTNEDPNNSDVNSTAADSHFNGPSMDESFPDEMRPKHRPGSFPMSLIAPFMGVAKVDSIRTYRSDLSNLNASILAKQQARLGEMHDNAENYRMNAAFIQFNHQLGAHLAAQAVIHPKTLSMAPRMLEVHPSDVLWDNLDLSLFLRNVHKVVAMILAIILIVFWSIPVTFVASVANLDVIVAYMPFLKGIYNWPTAILGIIQGLLPPIGLAILMAILPIILYKLAHLSGEVLGVNKTQQVMTSYHWFSVVHVLLVTTLANGIFVAVEQIKDNPSAIMEMLASSLPTASTFFVNYIMLAWIQVPLMLLQIAPLLLYQLSKFLAKTPRQIYANESAFSSVDWGMTIPPHTIAFAIGLIYSTIQPIILPIIVIYFGLFYLAYRHMFLYVYVQPTESGGLIFPRMIDQVYVALIIYQLTMLGLFILQRTIAISVIAFITLVSSIIAIVISRSKVYKPLIKYLPVEIFNRDCLDKVLAAQTVTSASLLSQSGAGTGAGVGAGVGTGTGTGATSPGDARSRPSRAGTLDEKQESKRDDVNDDKRGAGLLIRTDSISAAAVLESPMNPIARPESFHEKAPYKDPNSSPRIEAPERSRELFSPMSDKPRKRLSLESFHSRRSRASVDAAGGVIGVGGGTASAHGNHPSSEIPSIRVENAALVKEDRESASQVSKGVSSGHQSGGGSGGGGGSTSVTTGAGTGSATTTTGESPMDHSVSISMSSAGDIAPDAAGATTTASPTPAGTSTRGTTADSTHLHTPHLGHGHVHSSMQDYSEDASMKVLGGGPHSVLSIPDGGRGGGGSVGGGRGRDGVICLGLGRGVVGGKMDRATLEQFAYVHPALWATSAPIWLPKDPRGFAELETLELGDAGLSSTTEAATMDRKGKVTVDASVRLVAPGDLDWDI